jgi:hypothetical protein
MCTGCDLNVQTTTAQGSGAAGAGRYRSEQIEEQMRLMGNSAFNATPNSTEVLTTTGAIANNLVQDPGMPKTADGKVVVEVPGRADAAIQQFIIGNSTEGAGYIPGVSPYSASNTALNPPSTAYSLGYTSATAACANSDLACKSGICAAGLREPGGHRRSHLPVQDRPRDLPKGGRRFDPVPDGSKNCFVRRPVCAGLAAVPLGRRQLPSGETGDGRSACGLRDQSGCSPGRVASRLIN